MKKADIKKMVKLRAERKKALKNKRYAKQFKILKKLIKVK